MNDRPRFKSAEPFFGEFIDQDAEVRQIAEKVVSDPQWVNSTAQVMYRCKSDGCLLAAVVRHDGQRYLWVRDHLAPYERDGKKYPAAKRMDCLRLDDDNTARSNPPLNGVSNVHRLDCSHARYILTTAQLAADVTRLRGQSRRVVMIDGNRGLDALLAANPDQVAEDIPVVSSKVR